jgi:hypothetical protein
MVPVDMTGDEHWLEPPQTTQVCKARIDSRFSSDIP